MSKQYGVALIGCGQMGAVHLENIYYKDNVNVRCVCDKNEESAKNFMKRYNADYITTDIDRCLEDEKVDIVICATYPSTHLEIVQKCLEHGKHVLCEKPIGTSLEEGEKFASLVKAHPECKVLIGHILRHNHTYQTVAKMIQDGAIGFPVVIRMAQNHHTMNWPRYLKLIQETSPIIDCGVHYIDIMQWFTGEKITHVSGIGQRTEPDVPEDKYNYGLITVRLSGGSVGYYEAGWSNTMSSDNLKEFVGPLGSIRITYRKDRQSHQEEGDLIEYYRYPAKTYEMINVEGKRKPTDAQFDYLIQMIEENVEATPTIDEIFECFKLALHADEIIRQKEAETNAEAKANQANIR